MFHLPKVSRRCCLFHPRDAEFAGEFRQKRRLFRLPDPETFLLRLPSGSGTCFVFRVQAGCAASPAGGRRPSAQGVFCEENFPPRVAPKGRACPPFAERGAFPRLPGRTRNALPFSGPGREARCAFPIERGGLFAPADTRWPRFCRVLPEGGAQSAEDSPFCASSDACEGRSVKMISARESSSRISSSTPGSTITPERGFLMLSTRVVMTA